MEFLSPIWHRRLELVEEPKVGLAAILGIVTAYFAFLYIQGLYRLHLHPLSKFPGPPAAAKSDAWVFEESRKAYPEETFERLHKKYDTKALRIGPNELHITDTDLYKVIYRQSKPFAKHEPFYLGFNAASPTLFTEVDETKHKERRRMLNPMFSRAGVLKLESLIREKLTILEAKIDRLHQEQNIDFYAAFRLLTTDVIIQFACGDTVGMMEEQPNGFGARFLDAFDFAAHGLSTFQQYPILRNAVKIIPTALARIAMPEMAGVLDLIKFADDSRKKWGALRKEKKTSDLTHPLLYDTISSLSDGAMMSESVDLLVAGSDTTAISLTVAIWEILGNPDVAKRLIGDLDAAIPDKSNMPSFERLEKIDFLTACVKEGIRCAMAVPGRIPRVVPADDPQPLIVDGHVVPPGTVVSMSAHTMHYSTDIWGPDARSFNPSRWLAPNAKNLEQYQVAFSKGARMCIGQNLVPVEMTLTLASIFRRYTLSYPAGFTPPHRVDYFTVELEGGLPIHVQKRD